MCGIKSRKQSYGWIALIRHLVRHHVMTYPSGIPSIYNTTYLIQTKEVDREDVIPLSGVSLAFSSSVAHTVSNIKIDTLLIMQTAKPSRPASRTNMIIHGYSLTFKPIHSHIHICPHLDRYSLHSSGVNAVQYTLIPCFVLSYHYIV